MSDSANKQEGWADYFSNNPNLKDWLQEKWQTHQPVYDLLNQLLPPNGKMLEVGCGLAATSIKMSLGGISCMALDIDPKVLKLAEELNQGENSNVSFVQGDMFNLTEHYGRFDVVYSGGVLEHLDETEAIKLLSEQSKVAKLVLTVIPTKSEKQKAPILRFPYGIKELVSFGEKAGLKPYSVLLFKGIESSQCHRLTKHKDLDVFIQSLDLIPAQRIGVVFKSPMIKSITI